MPSRVSRPDPNSSLHTPPPKCLSRGPVFLLRSYASLFSPPRPINNAHIVSASATVKAHSSALLIVPCTSKSTSIVPSIAQRGSSSLSQSNQCSHPQAASLPEIPFKEPFLHCLIVGALPLPCVLHPHQRLRLVTVSDHGHSSYRPTTTSATCSASVRLGWTPPHSSTLRAKKIWLQHRWDKADLHARTGWQTPVVEEDDHTSRSLAAGFSVTLQTQKFADLSNVNDTETMLPELVRFVVLRVPVSWKSVPAKAWLHCCATGTMTCFMIGPSLRTRAVAAQDSSMRGAQSLEPRSCLRSVSKSFWFAS